MGKYFVLWELNASKIPIDPKEKIQGYSKLMAMVRKDFEKGSTIDWGAFVGEGKGYSLMEGTEVEVSAQLQQFVPFCIFKVYSIMSETQVNEMIKALAG